MKAIVISHMYPTVAQPLSGIFVQKQIEALQAQGVKVTLVNPTPWFPGMFQGAGKWGKYAQVPEKEIHQGMEIYHPKVIELPKGILFDYYPATYRLGMEKLMDRLVQEQKPDVLHAHVAHPDGAAAVALGKKYNLPVVVTVHGQDFAHTLKRSPKSAQSVKDTLRQAKRVILVSHKLKENYELDKWADDLNKYKVIYNGVNLEESRTEGNGTEGQDTCPAGDRDKCPVPPSHTLLTVGFLRKPKGHAYVLEALAGSPSLLRDYPDLMYRIVGDGAERKNLEEKVKELGLEKHVEFLGSLPHPQAMEEMRRCQIFVMPSWDEAFGVVYLEALAHGKPVIGTKGEGIAALLEKEGVGLTVRPRNAADVGFALEQLLTNRSLAQEMGRKGRELVYRDFTWEHNARKTIEVYQECLGS